MKAISTLRRGALDSKRRGTKLKLIKSLHVEEAPRKIAKADQVYQDLQSKYSYSLNVIKENEEFRMYTQQAMDNFDDPELELPYEDSDFDDDTAFAFVSQKEFKETKLKRMDTSTLVAKSEIKKLMEESERIELDKTKHRPFIIG